MKEFQWFEASNDDIENEQTGRVECAEIRQTPSIEPCVIADINNNSSIHYHWLCSKKTKSIYSYLSTNAKGRNIPIILDDVKTYICSPEFPFVDYWYFVDTLINYNASLFLATLAKYSPNESVIPECDDNLLSNIINNAFKAEDKIYHALHLIKPCKKQLSYELADIIIKSCVRINNPDLIGEAFLFLTIPPSIAINILKDNIDSMAAAFALYNYYRVTESKKMISEQTIIEVFSYPYISSLVNNLEKLGEPQKIVGKMISNTVFHSTYPIDKKLVRVIKENGYVGFQCYLRQKTHEKDIKNNLKNIAKTNIYNFYVICRLENHYLVYCRTLNRRALLPIESLIDKVELNPKEQIHAYVSHFDNRHNVLFAYQRNIESKIELINVGSFVEISFSIREEKLYSTVRNYTNLLNANVVNINFITDYKAKYLGKIIRRNSFFDYEVELILAR